VSKVAGVRDFIGEQNRYERALAKSMGWDFVGQYAVAYRTQLEFYAWFLQQRMKAEGRSEEGGNLFECIMDIVEHCTLGQITEVLFETQGRFRRDL
jgi:hypothetical protein